MIAGVSLKICGLAGRADAEAADRAGADFLGFNLYPKSPRFIPIERYLEIAGSLPAGKRVAVMVEPSEIELEAVRAEFDYFQIHFRPEVPFPVMAGWAEAVGVDRMWLAPRLRPGSDFDPAWLPLAKFFLVDTFQAAGFGGSGLT